MMQNSPFFWRAAVFTGFILALVLGAAYGNVLGSAVTGDRSTNGSLMPSAAPEQTGEVFPVYLPKVFISHPWMVPFGVESVVSLWEGSTVTTRTIDTRGGWVRYGWQISWRDLQPVENGPIIWSYLASFEKELRDMRYSGTRPVVVIKDSPHWAVDPSARDSDGALTSCGPIQPNYYDDFAAFVTEVVNRYKTDEFNVHDWEIGNEPDVDPDLVPPDYIFGCWGDIDDTAYYGGDKFGQMLIVVSQAIKQADPAAQVWVGGLLLAQPNTTDPTQGKPENFLRGILAAGAAPYIDIVPYHWHSSYWNAIGDYDNAASSPWDAWGGGILGKARYLRQIMADYGVSKPVFLNESGFGCIPSSENINSTWCEPPDASFFENQAYYIVRTYVRGLSEDVMGMIWYSINGPGWRNSGLLDSLQQPRPAYHAYKHMVERLGSLAYQSKPDYGAGIEAYTFTRQSQRTDVLWAIQASGSFSVSVPTSAFIAAYDLFGNPIDSQPVGDSYPIPVGFSPVFILRTP
jgi:hypothetical protein